MLTGKKPKEIREAIDIFLSQEKTSSHGRMINSEGVKDCGLTVEEIDLHSDTWETVWELYVRSDWAVSRFRRKLIESAKSAVAVGHQ